MGCGEYNLVYDMAGLLIAEDNESNKWMVEASRKTSPQAVTLEDEIHILRNRMEKMFLQEKSFTSDIVIEISRLLDLKINEFMKKRSKKQ
ncbi:aspartyl-phosphate phosphatase Spo0E family protein [Paenibacillus motobuensis]|nr:MULTISPECIES: aspartyl-phosphate phosphatase Spo0E family protein [Paenibacillus]MCM3038863.1 aspartyl-phosphate phosphatase Spo0E family protein [Paenibacillus lutimineralis]MCM3645967.1 aspartyl-phosphate phosphatase Spo0E family protein [Paenibacillus motobuensis]